MLLDDIETAVGERVEEMAKDLTDFHPEYRYRDRADMATELAALIAYLNYRDRKRRSEDACV